MKKERRKNCAVGVALLAGFVLWTVLVCYTDVQVIGPQGSEVGFATLNGFIHRLLGVHMTLYTVTDWLGLVPVGTGICFALLGLIQWIRRGSLRYVEGNILLLGGFYSIVAAVYLLFEKVVVNYRPVLIGGILESSYPSSTTVLAMCVMPTAVMQFRSRIKSKILYRVISAGITVFTAFMVVGRLISGVHWLTDIIGGALFSTGMVKLYSAVTME